jgi:peptide/nickel transport system substrate-binding protein
MKKMLLAGLLAVCANLSPLEAKPFRWANDGDVNSMDPYARNETFSRSC